MATRAYIAPEEKHEPIDLDFSGVNVATPSWIDEYVSGLEAEFGSDRVRVLPSGNASVRVSLKAVRLR